jgi:hypothetical protein
MYITQSLIFTRKAGILPNSKSLPQNLNHETLGAKAGTPASEFEAKISRESSASAVPSRLGSSHRRNKG